MKSNWRKLSWNPSLRPYILQRHGILRSPENGTWCWRSHGLWHGALRRASRLLPAAGCSQHTCPSKSLQAPRLLHSGRCALALVLDGPGSIFCHREGRWANVHKFRIAVFMWQVWDKMSLKERSQGGTPSQQRALALRGHLGGGRGTRCENRVSGDGFLRHRGLGRPLSQLRCCNWNWGINDVSKTYYHFLLSHVCCYVIIHLFIY